MAFLHMYFPFTHMKIKALTDTWAQTQVAIFPMFIQTKKNSDGSIKRWETGPDIGHPIIDVENRMPKCSMQQCVEAINFIGKLVS